MDTFVEVVNLTSAEAMWAHFATVAVHPSQLWITGYPRAYDIKRDLLLIYRNKVHSRKNFTGGGVRWNLYG